MADFLGGLLGGGGGLYDDLLTPQQQSQLSSRGLLAMAGAFADAGMPSRLPIPLGAAIGKAAAAMGTGRDQAALQVLQAQKLAQEVQTQKIQAALQQQMFEDFKSMPLAEFLKRHAGAAGGGVPAAAAPGAAPAAAAPAAPVTSNPLAGPGPLPIDLGGTPTGERIPLDGPAPGVGTGLLAPARSPSAQPLDAPGAGSGSSGGFGGLLSPASYGGGAGTPPFGGRGQGGETPGAGGDDEVGSGGGAPANQPGDPRGLIPYIRERATAAGIDPDVAVKVAQSEGLGTFRSSVIQRNGQREPSYGAFQLYTGGGMGNDFQRDTGLDPSDPKNERATIDYALSKAPSTGWTPWHGAAGAGIGPRTGLPGGPDYVAPSGRGVPANMLRQVADNGFSGGGAAPGAPGGAPATAAAGGDGQGMNTLLLELAKRNAMAEILKLGNPYGSMLSVLQGSPEYKGQIAGAEAKAQQPYIQGNQANQSYLNILQDMAKDNMTVDANGKVVLLPEAQRIRTMNAEQQAEAKSKWETPVEQPVHSPDGTIKLEKMSPFEFRRREADKARRAALGDTMPRPGDLAQTPYVDPITQAQAGPKATGEQQRQTELFQVTPGLVNPRMLPPGPGTTQPITLPSGSVLPPASLQPANSGSIAQVRKDQEINATQEGDWLKGIGAATFAENRLMAIADALKTFQSGAFQGNLADLRAKLSAVGIHVPDSFAGDPAKAQQILKDNFAASVEMMKSTGLSRWTQQELARAQTAMANPGLQPAANHSILAQAIGAIRWERGMQEAYAQAKQYGWSNPSAFQLYYQQQNPLAPVVEQTRKDLGPFRGMPQPASPGTVLPPGGARIPRYNPDTGKLE